jgi:hypothetical protein
MITMRRQLLGLGFVAASSLLALHTAQAMSGPTAITIDGGPFGSLNISGGVDGYGYYLTGTGSNDAYGTNVLGDHNNGNGFNSNNFEIGSALIELQKTTGELQYTIEVGSNGGTAALGTAPGKTSITTFSTGALYAGYVTIAPTGLPVTFSAGQIASLEGWESGVDWNNANQLTTEIFYVQNSQSRGVSANYTSGPISATVTFGDGYDNGVWNYLQFLATLTLNPTNAVSVYGGVNLGTTGPYTTSYGGDNAIYANSNTYGAFYSYTMGNLNVVPEVQYQYTKAIYKIGLTKPASNLGAAVFADYSFGTSPYSIGTWVEGWTSHQSAGDTDTPANNYFSWFIGPNSSGVGVSMTPTWQYKDLFARFDAGALYLLHNKDGNGFKYGYGPNGTGKYMFTGELEAGLLF